MEQRLKKLLEGNSEAERAKWAIESKKQGRKVIGVISSYVVEEVISAAGMLPWRINGKWTADISHTRAYRSENSCGYCNHVLESFLTGELDFLDGIVITDLDQDLVRLWDVLVYLKVKPFCHIMHIPFVDTKLSRQFLKEEISRMIKAVEEFGGVKITEESLRLSIETYNQWRRLLGRIYELRKREIPPLSGAETLSITTASSVVPKEYFNQELEALLPYLEGRKTNLKEVRPRLLIESDMLDQPAYLSLVEEEGCLIAMDDMDTGTRLFAQEVDTSQPDLTYALAERYLSRHGVARMASWDEQVEQLIKWVSEFNIDGVLALPLAWCYPQRYRIPFLAKKLEQAGILFLSIEREYHLANAGQIKARVGAFLEVIRGRLDNKPGAK